MLFKNHGIGLGLRHPHISHFKDSKHSFINWVEVVTENYLKWENGFQPRGIENLLSVRENHLVALHGVSMNLASINPLDMNYLKRLKELSQKVSPILISDHLCWTGFENENTHDLLPFPFTKFMIQHISDKIKKAQDFLGQRIAIENISSYIQFSNSDYTEWEFISEISEKSDCGILLDINNVFVNSKNHNFNPHKYLLSLPNKRIAQIHLAGHSIKENFLLDSHDSDVCKEVWDLYSWFLKQVGSFSVMIERDGNLPEWKDFEKEIKLLKLKTFKESSKDTNELSKDLITEELVTTR